LVNHLLHWGPALEAAARKEDAASPDEHRDLVTDDWAPRLERRIDRLVAAWGEPAAWTGVTRLGSPSDLPAAMIGGMVLGEIVVHGWDLARATGQHVRWDDEPLEFLHDEVAKTAEMGRGMGVYGPAVPVPQTAPPLDRILGLTGRDPRWQPSGSQVRAT
jgi:uncharacterized protein (TIGR03086 family)